MIMPLCNIIGNLIIEAGSSRGSHPPRSPERSERRRDWSDKRRRTGELRRIRARAHANNERSILIQFTWMVLYIYLHAVCTYNRLLLLRYNAFGV
jgi:hypothetical protein